MAWMHGSLIRWRPPVHEAGNIAAGDVDTVDGAAPPEGPG